MSWFGWLIKPKILVTGLDEVVEFSELFFVLILFYVVWAIYDIKRRNEIKRQHGKNCTCFTCMGVT